MYDFAHPIEDAIEGITHSLCTLEFEAHRPLYDWVLREVGVVHASNFIYLQSLVTMVVSAIVLDERITPMAIAGAIILILGMLRALK